MLNPSRSFALIGVLSLLATACSKHASQVVDPAVSGAASERADAPDPTPFLVQLHFVGPVVTLAPDFSPILERHADFYVRSNGGTTAAPDTVPAHSVLRDVRWRLAVGSGGSSGGRPEYFDDVPVFGDGSGPDNSKEFTPGLHILRLIVPARAGGGTITVMVFVDFAPVAWWAGPDPALFPPSSDGDGRAVDVTDWSRFTTTPAWPPDRRGYFGPDSFRFVPSQRRPVADDFQRRTFYEIYGDRIYARAEGDTVHLNAWVVFATGGFDRDSRYAPIVDPTDPGLPPGFASRPDLYPVLLPQDLIGSPSAFRSLVLTKLPDGSVIHPSETTSFPNFDPNSVFRDPHVAGYWRMSFPGKAYSVALAVDAEGQVGRVHGDPVDLADRVDAGGGSPSDRAERLRILTFYVRGAAPTVPAEAE